MVIASRAKYPQLVCVVLLLCIARNVAKVCDINNQTSATFESNLNVVVNNLVRNTSSPNYFNTSVYGQSPDRVYGFLQCYGDATVAQCFNCSQDIANKIRESCENARSSQNRMDNCFLRYENYSFIGVLDNNRMVYYSLAQVSDKPDVFRTAVTELFRNLSDEALQSPILYSSGSTITSTFYTIYSLVQCWRYLTSVEDCKQCLTSAIREVLDATFTGNRTSPGGRTEGGSCFVRYETSKFFNPRPPPSVSPSPSPPPIEEPRLSPPTKSPNKVGSAKSPNKAGLVLGIVGGFLVMLLICLFAIRRKFKFAVFGKPVLLRKDSAIGQEREMSFNLENIKAATNNFHEDNKLGEGGFGSVYKGIMPNGMPMAVKRLSVQSVQGKNQFLNEVKLVAKIQHRNLVNLLGCCAEGSERLLVYEFLPNKSLDKILFHPQRREEIDWPKRFNIILGVARGLLYLHQDSQLRIIHRDIKASNILLDEKMQPKISDFGLARLFDLEETHVNTMVAGTLGYMAPEYAVHGKLSVKADVYSFGVVILEIICGRKNTDSRLPLEFQSLLEWVWRPYKERNFINMIDKAILNSFPNEQISRSIHVSLLCTQENPSLRPSMVNVHAMLSNTSVSNLPDPAKPAYLNITQDKIQPHTTTSTSTSTTLSTSSTTHLAIPSINDTSITDLGPR